MKISIITVSYNSSKTIKDTLESVYSQTYDDIEYILVDGKSKDTTLEVIKSHESDFVKKGIAYKWVSEKDKGIYDAINKGIRMSTGDVIGVLNSDDYYNDIDVVKGIAEAFKNENIDCVYGNLEYVDPVAKKVTRKWTSRQFESGLFEKSWTPAHPTFYCKKSLYEKHGVYRTDFEIAADVELMYRFLEKHKIKSKYINRAMVIMRQGGISNNGIMSTITITREMKQAFKDNGGNLNLLKYLGYKALKIKEFIVK